MGRDRGGDDRSSAGSRRPPAEIVWLEEHGAEFYWHGTTRKTRVFRTPADMERWFRADHGHCKKCDGTGFMHFDKRWVFNRGIDPKTRKPREVFVDAPCVRRCPDLPPMGSPTGWKPPSEGLTPAAEGAPGWLPYKPDVEAQP